MSQVLLYHNPTSKKSNKSIIYFLVSLTAAYAMRSQDKSFSHYWTDDKRQAPGVQGGLAIPMFRRDPPWKRLTKVKN